MAVCFFHRVFFSVLSSGNIIKDIIYLFFMQSRGASVDLQGILLGPSGFQGKWGLVRNGEGFKAEGDIRLLICYLIKVLFCQMVRLIGTLLQCLTFCSLCFFLGFLLLF